MRPAVILLPLLLGACAVGSMPSRKVAAPEYPDLADVFDCLRERRLALVSAHRGQADPTRAENALTSFRETEAKGPILIELDIARTSDGALVLLHDDRLDRTTTGTGPIGSKTFAEIRRLRLKDPQGQALEEKIPSLDEALTWARRTGAILQLDLKRGVTIPEVLEAVRSAGMERQVILISYTHADARTALKLAPEMMVSMPATSPADAQLVLARPGRRHLAFTGLSEPSPALIARLDAAKVEAITATLGAEGTRLDDRYMADGNGDEYARLAERGVTLIASDRPLDAWDALEDADRDGAICLKGNAR